jgi:hypothetical protein
MHTENRTKKVAKSRKMVLDEVARYIIERQPPRKVRLQSR